MPTMFEPYYVNAREPPKLAMMIAVIGTLCITASCIVSFLLLYSAL